MIAITYMPKQGLYDNVALNGHKNAIKIHFKKILSPDIGTAFSMKIDLNTCQAIKNNVTGF